VERDFKTGLQAGFSHSYEVKTPALQGHYPMRRGRRSVAQSV